MKELEALPLDAATRASPDRIRPVLVGYIDAADEVWRRAVLRASIAPLHRLQPELSMALPFPSDEPFLRGYYAPLLAECDADNLPVSGELPKDLNGWLYRNGPNPQFAPRGPYHWFAGDGMLHAFHVENGRVAYRNRWVRTPKWELEHAEREGLSGAFGNPRYSDPRIVELGSTLANTNVVWHGGRLLALEEAHAPFEVDPVTLASKGSWNYGGRGPAR